MSKPTKKGNTFAYTPTQELPKLKKYPTAWDMKGHYYKSITDPQIEKDVATTEKLYAAFVKKFKKTDFTSNPKTLLAALNALNAIDENPVVAKPTRYLGLLSALDTTDAKVANKLNLLGQRLTIAGNSLLFFGIDLGNVNKGQQKKFLQNKDLEGYKYMLQNLFNEAKHTLTESEEKILRLTSNCSYGMWVDATEKMIGRRTVNYKGKKIPLNEALNLVSTLDFKESPKLWRLVMLEMKSLEEVVENELTAIATRMKIGDELRGYKKPYSASVQSKEDDEKSVEMLVQAVSSKGFTLSKKFYKQKAKLHGVETLEYAQRSAAIKAAPVIDFAQATEICRDVFYGVNSMYGETFDDLLTNGQIDVYPKKGKQGGAFLSSETAQPSKVLLNHVNDITSMETYAHEMGHAIHSERSKTQPAHYEGYSLTTAETASTLFEGLLFDAILDQATDEQKVVLLHDKLGRDVSTIQRQIAFFNFELEMHTVVREQGGITHQELNKMMQKHLKSYMGPAVNITELDGSSYVYVGHFRYGFYVYTYTFGTLMSTIMAENFTADNSYAKQIDQFLTAGGSDNVANIFKSIGLNTKKVETFEYGLEKMNKEITLLKKLTK